MKNIIIAGSSRVGKTTLSLKLAKELHYNYYKMDSIKFIIDKFLNKEEQCNWKKVSPILVNAIEQICQSQEDEKDGMPIIFDTCHIYPKDLERLKDKYLIYYLGTEHIDPKDYVERIKTFDKDTSWTRKLNDTELYKRVYFNISHSKELKNECNTYGFNFYDFSNNRNQIMEELESKIISDCKNYQTFYY